MMLKTTYLPAYSYGESIFSSLSTLVQPYGKSVLIIGGKNALSIAQSSIIEALSEKLGFKLQFELYGGECTMAHIDRLVQIGSTLKPDLILGVGGGKAIDTAKAVADRLNLPIMTLPTIASTCAATTFISIVYNNEGTFDKVIYLKKPPVHVLIDVSILLRAPMKYIWAGIGDTIAKYYEVSTSSRDRALSQIAQMGKSLSVLCVDTIERYGREALDSVKSRIPSDAFIQVLQTIIINTGFVSMMVGDENNGALAHGLFYGLTLLPEIEEKHLHGEVVALGVLALLAYEKNAIELNRMKVFYRSVALPCALSDLGISLSDPRMLRVIEKTLNAPDTNKMGQVPTFDEIKRVLEVLEAQ